MTKDEGLKVTAAKLGWTDAQFSGEADEPTQSGIAGLGLCRATRIGHALRVGTTRGPGDAVARRHAPGEKGASGCAAVRPDKDKQGI